MDTLQYILNKYHLEPADKIEIPNVGRNDLAPLLAELGFKTGVEVGVQRGDYSEVLCKANPQMTLYGVDPWESEITSETHPDDRRTENSMSQETCDKYYERTKARLAPYPNYHILKKYSVDAAARFPDESLDFVYIDANHKTPFVTQDITIWNKKVRKGGIVSGHDYLRAYIKNKEYMLEIKQVVDKFVKDNHISPLIIWGLKDAPGLYRDKYRSWMWIKQ